MFFVGLALAGVSVGLSLYQMWDQAGTEAALAEAQAKSIKKEISLLEKQKYELAEKYREKGDIVRDKYGGRVGTLLDRVGSSIEQARERGREAEAQTGLATSGTVREATGKTVGRMESASMLGQGTLKTQYESDVFDLEMAEERELGQLDYKIQSLWGQWSVAQTQSNVGL